MQIQIKELIERKELQLLKNIDNLCFLEDTDVSNLHINLIAKIISQNLLIVHGLLIISINKQCSRCLDCFNNLLSIDFFREYDIDCNEKMIDLSLDIKEEFWLNIPVVFTCKDSCNGLCQFCGINLNNADCNCQCENQDFTANSFSKLQQNSKTSKDN